MSPKGQTGTEAKQGQAKHANREISECHRRGEIKGDPETKQKNDNEANAEHHAPPEKNSCKTMEGFQNAKKRKKKSKKKMAPPKH